MISTTPPAAASKIEALNAARLSLLAEAENDAFDIDAFCIREDAILDALSLEKPETPAEIGVMLGALEFHLDLLLNGIPEAESEGARLARGAKVERILASVRAALPAAIHYPPNQVAVILGAPDTGYPGKDR